MNIFSKKLLMGGKKEYTLTVVTDPASATCTLTYDGVSHNSKTATVKAGTVISYSVYQATYGTTTGTITMDSNKTLTCTGTYSTSTTQTPWTRPALSSDGTMGGFNYAASASSATNRSSAYQAFDGDTSSYWITNSALPQSVTYYSPFSVRLTSLSIANRSIGNYYVAEATIQGSNNGSSWTPIGTYSNSTNDKGVYHSANLTNTSSYFQYFRIYITSRGGSGSYTNIGDCTMSGYRQDTYYTYYWNKSIT